MANRYKLLTLAVVVLTLVAGVFFAVDTRAEADVAVFTLDTQAEADSKGKKKGNTVKATMNLFDAATGIRYDPGTPVKGSRGKLSRHDDEVWADIKTHRLPPGAYTNWWVIFNNPSECATEFACGGGDLSNPAVKGAVFFATGGIVGADGKGHFKAHLQEGGMSGLPFNQIALGVEGDPGLMPGKATGDDPAEIHYVIRFHGPENTNLPGVTVEDMITTLGGGCNTTPPTKGTVGNYPCWDPQAVGFPMPNN